MFGLPRVVIYSPAGLLDPRMVVAAARAGSIGIFDLGSPFDPILVRETLTRTRDLLPERRFGVRVAEESLETIDFGGVTLESPVVVISGDERTNWADALVKARSCSRMAVAEVTTRIAAQKATLAGYDALILSGNEAGGRVSEDSTFILLQAVLAAVKGEARVWARGGIGPSVAAGCVAAGATGVVLDGAVLLARESPLSEEIQARIASWDGGETSLIEGGQHGRRRVFTPHGSEGVGPTRILAKKNEHSSLDISIGWGPGQAWPVGQDSALAAELAQRFVTVGGIVQEVERAIDAGITDARAVRPLCEGSPLARAHETRFPIVQGPMTRVSDRPTFALAIAEGGALPLVALALMRGDEVRRLLEETRNLLPGRTWGVGILGFVPPELRNSQVEAILSVPPPFALIAGGRPDQARVFEEAKIPTYLHVPSPGLLSQFLRDGARRFVLEGRECGGHVGPRSSFVLWEQAARVLIEAIERGIEASTIHILYAGGIHDARSSAFVSAVSAPLAARGVRVGVLMGTAYLFTREAVETGAIVEGFQREALDCKSTVLLETGPGHLVRVSPTPFVESFQSERRRMMTEGYGLERIRSTLEDLNVGRLRIAAKGVDRSDGGRSALLPVSVEDQRERGLYMLGQAATLRDRLITIAELHTEISIGGPALLERIVEPPSSRMRRREPPSDVAIIGMSAFAPGAVDVRTLWENVLRGRDAITEVPADRWDWRLYFDTDAKTPDKITSRWGGFLPEVPFDPLDYGMPPTSLPSIEPMHLLTLEAVRAALDDAGYRDRPFPRERTAVVLGAGGGAAQLAMGYAFRSYLPLLDTVTPGAGTEALAQCGRLLPEWTEDSFPGILLNVAAGRVANRFDLGGANYTVDAACGSSLAAASQAVRELESGAADMVVLGGADTVQNPFTYLAFSKTHAFSGRGRCRPFDAKADGIVISEAVAVLVLKRLADAERDGDRIYAVIKGIGASSDGRAKGLTAPRYEGQVRALERAYEKAGINPSSIGYVEAHGTGTAAGDMAEVQALSDVYARAGAANGGTALGSVKSLVGHTKCAAGLVGLINASLALYHRSFPPTIGIETPNPRAQFSASPFRPNTQPRPWMKVDPSLPRRAGVSAFGFGGTNFHAVLEAYEGDPAPAPVATREWPAELFAWRELDRQTLLRELDRLASALRAGPTPALRDLSQTLLTRFSRCLEETTGGPGLAIVAGSIDDLLAKLASARKGIVDGRTSIHDSAGIDYAERGMELRSRIAFLFPGQGSQSPGMLGEVALLFPEVSGALEEFDQTLGRLGRRAIGPLIYPAPPLDEGERERQQTALAATEIAQPALGAVEVGLSKLLTKLGVEPDVAAGHSYGELVALHSAGVFSLEALAEVSDARGRLLREALGPGAMAAIGGSGPTVEALLEGIDGVVVANRNGPSQTVVSGTSAGVAKAVDAARERRLSARILPVSHAFHSPLARVASAPLAALAAHLASRPPRIPVYSNVTASRHGADPAEISRLLGDHLASPVRFGEMIETMYAEDVRIFIEIGPGAVLTSLVDSILGARPHLAVACEPAGRKGLAGFLGTLGRLVVAGSALQVHRLTDGRSARLLTWTEEGFGPVEPALKASTWLVNGNRARPAFGPEPQRFGPGPALPKPASSASNGAEPWSRIPHARNGRHVSTAVTSDATEASPAEAVFLAFQRTMKTFLEVQRTTALAFLATENGSTSSDVTGHSEGPAAVQASRRRLRTSSENDGEQAPATSTTHEAGVLPDSVKNTLLSIVRDRTGYPVEMLGLDLDLEADLGIDSIKRVEILGTLRESIAGNLAGSDAELMDQLSRARTLGAIVDRVSSHFDVGAVSIEDSARRLADVERPPCSEHESAARRLILEPVDAPLVDDGFDEGSLKGRIVLVTDDRGGVARRVCAALEARGIRALRVAHISGQADATNADDWRFDFTSPTAIARLAECVGHRGRVSAIVHALPLRELSGTGLDQGNWTQRLAVDARGLFLLAKAFAENLALAGAGGSARLIAATAMGGGFGSFPIEATDFCPAHGAIAGLMKTFAREWPSVNVRVVDLDRSEGPDLSSDRLLAELFTRDGLSEVGYLSGRRIALRTVESELDRVEGLGVELSAGDPILVTGGARGITAEVVCDIARRWRPKLLIVGTSPLPTEEEVVPPGLNDPSELKANLLANLARNGRSSTPRELEHAYRSLRRSREIRENLSRFRQAGATVEYAAVDVRDAHALSATLARWLERHGPLAGLIHGAGVIHDKLVLDKTPESFDRVLGTKLDGALTLARLVSPEHLKFAAFFSSIAGRFGNRGQADYAAANEAVNKLALWLDRHWPCRVLSLIWGPWSDVGMVSDLARHLGRQGLGMIPPSEGRSLLADELRFGVKGDVEVILAAELGGFSEMRVGTAERTS